MSKDGYTHIVLGAGTAGVIAAARLAENPDFRVLLVEAGGRGRYDPMLKVPIMTGLLLRGRRHVWRYTAGPEPGLHNRQLDLPRGKVLGGSSAINGMVYARGLPRDYELWAQAGMPGWSWEKVKPFFLKSENFQGPGGDPAHHSTSGPMTISRRAKPVSPLATAFVQAGIAAGYPHCADFNSDAPDGFGLYHFTNRRGYRETTATAFLDRAGHKPNLTISTGQEVVRIIVTNGCATGVALRAGCRTRIIETDGEIILCCGAIGSPAILMRSGIGPAEHLHSHGIQVLLDSPNVGENLQDHVLIRVTHASSADVSLHSLTRPDRAALRFMQALLFGTGPMSVFPLEAGAYYRTDGSDMPTVQSHFLPALGSATIRLNPFVKAAADTGPGFMANASVMQPNSRGRIRLGGADVDAALAICVNYLDNARDVEVLVDAVGVLRDVFSQRAFAKYRKAELSPGIDVRSRTQLREWVRATADTVHHLCGSCRMGNAQTDVVDEELKLRGLRGLRIADASIFPTIPSTNTAAAAMMVGERVSEFIQRSQ